MDADDIRRIVADSVALKERFFADNAALLLQPEQAAGGAVLSLDVPVTADCDGCGGTGGQVFDCELCHGEGKVARRLPVPVHVPAGLREGTVFQVRTDDPAVPSILLTVHVRRV